MAREGPVQHQGFHYSMPYTGEDGTGLGKPLKSILQADNDIPIYTASITPRGLTGSAEVADGVFSNLDESGSLRCIASTNPERS